MPASSHSCPDMERNFYIWTFLGRLIYVMHMRTGDAVANASDPVLKEFLELSIRYHRKTATIYQSLVFLMRAEIAAESAPELKTEIDKFEKYLEPYSLDYKTYFYGLLLFALVADFEIYLVDIIKALIQRYPKKIGDVEFRLSEILDSTHDELITAAAEDYLNRLMYKKPSEYLSDLAKLLAIDASPLTQYWPKFIEAKARRDLGMHNGWKMNDVYIRKLTEAGIPSPAAESVMLPDIEYLHNALHACDDIVEIIEQQLTEKYAA